MCAGETSHTTKYVYVGTSGSASLGNPGSQQVIQGVPMRGRLQQPMRGTNIPEGVVDDADGVEELF